MCYELEPQARNLNEDVKPTVPPAYGDSLRVSPVRLVKHGTPVLAPVVGQQPPPIPEREPYSEPPFAPPFAPPDQVPHPSPPPPLAPPFPPDPPPKDKD